MGRTAEHSFPRYYKIGAAETRDPTELKALVPTTTGISSGRYGSLQRPQGTYHQVAAGKTLYLSHFVGISDKSAGTAGEVEVGYGDDTVDNSTTDATNYLRVAIVKYLAGSPYIISEDIWGAIPAGKYPCAYCRDGGWGFTVFGIEV